MTVRAAIAALLAGLSISAHAIANSPKRVDIPAGGLRQALLEAAKQFGTELLYSPEQIQGIQTRGARGELTTEQAVTMLLEGTPFELRIDPSGAMLITTPAAPEGEATADEGGKEAQSSKVTELEEIVVTGTHLRGNATMPSPVTVFNSADIQRFGMTSAGDVLRALPENQATSGTYTNFGASSFANLRGLGDGTTLVLIDGRRPPSSAASMAGGVAAPAQFNLNVIPLGAIDRIEILRDGASAIYGADAVGGVINIILRRDFTGVEVAAKHSASSDIDENDYTLVAGGSIGPLSAMLGGEYYDRGELLGADRFYSAHLDKTPLGGTNGSSPFLAGPLFANISALPGAGNLPGLSAPIAAVPEGDPRPLRPADFAATAGQANPAIDYVSFVPIAQPHHRTSTFGRVSWALTESSVVSLDGLYTTSSTNQAILFPIVNGLFAAGNPYNPFGVDTLVSFYPLDVPASKSRMENEDYGIAASLTHNLRADWQLRLSANTSESTFGQTLTGYDALRVAQALASTDPATALNPLFGARGTPDGVLDSLSKVTQDGDTKVRSRGVLAGASGTAFDLPAGRVSLATGAEARRELLDVEQFSQFSNPSDVSVSEDRHVASAYVEIGVPIWRPEESAAGTEKGLQLSGAARYESYSDFGDSTHPKLGLVWHAARGFEARATWGTAFQAPSLGQLYSPQTVTPAVLFFAPIHDPVLNQTYNFTGSFIARGNQELQPQEADTLSIGVSYEREAWAASIDWYSVELEGRIRTPATPQEIVDLESLYPLFIVRDPSTNRIVDVVSSPINLARVKTSGIDATIEYRAPVFRGDLSLSLSGTAVTDYDLQQSPLAPMLDRRSYIGFSNELKGNFQITYSLRPWQGSAILYYSDAYRSDVQSDREIRSHTTVDLQLSYNCCESTQRFLRGMRISLGAINVFDREPPFYNGFLGFDQGEGDPIQRRLYAKVALAF